MMVTYSKILVSGATGFIGRRLTRVLLERGCSVRCMLRRDSAGIAAGAEIVRADMLDRGPKKFRVNITDG